MQLAPSTSIADSTPTHDSCRPRLAAFLEERFGVPPARVRDAARLDGLANVRELVVALRDAMGIALTARDLEGVETFGELVVVVDGRDS